MAAKKPTAAELKAAEEKVIKEAEELAQAKLEAAELKAKGQKVKYRHDFDNWKEYHDYKGAKA